MVAEVEKSEGGPAVEEEEEMTVLDFDMLCSTVAVQTQKGKWGEFIQENEGENLASEYLQYGGVSRMWEGELLYGCHDDQNIALQSTCCPWYRFGKNMKRAGFGPCLFQGSIHLILVIIGLCNMLVFIINGRLCYLYLAIAFTVAVGIYMGYYRWQIRKKFQIKGSDSSFDDCIYHLICPCCTLCQESRTLEMNNVQDGIWHGRGDTICIKSFSTNSKLALSESSSHFVVSTKSPEFFSKQRTSIESDHLLSSVVEQNSPLVPPPK